MMGLYSRANYSQDGLNVTLWHSSSNSDTTASSLSVIQPMVYETTKPWPFLKQPMPMIIILTLAYVLVFLLGVVNNCLVVCVIYRNRHLRTVTNYFIANLAVADILVCILVLPITLFNNIFVEWHYGPFVCKAAPYLQGVAVGASVNTLTAVAIERFLAIFYPQTRRIAPTNACIIIGLIWIIPMCIFIPWIVVYTQLVYRIDGFDYVMCHADWPYVEQRKMFNLFAVFLTCYLIPLIFIAIFYLFIGLRVWKRKVRGLRGRARQSINRSKIRIVRMLVVVFLVFVMSWLPLYSIELRIIFGRPPSPEEKDILQNYLVPFAQWLGASNSCVNPFIYVYYSKNFRQSIIAVLHEKRCCSNISV